MATEKTFEWFQKINKEQVRSSVIPEMFFSKHKLLRAMNSVILAKIYLNVIAQESNSINQNHISIGICKWDSVVRFNMQKGENVAGKRFENELFRNWNELEQNKIY